MSKILFVLSLTFSLFAGRSEAAPEINQETVQFLKPKLNSDRIEYFFGNYGVNALAIDSPAFPLSRYFGSVLLSPQLMNWMDETSIQQGALHAYRLEVSGEVQPECVPYCTILEVHSPQYLTQEWLEALYENEYKECSIKSKEAEEFLDRLSILTQDFPPYAS